MNDQLMRLCLIKLILIVKNKINLIPHCKNSVYFFEKFIIIEEKLNYFKLRLINTTLLFYY